MSKFLRIGQELTKIHIDNRNIEEYNIVVHNSGDLRSPGIMPTTTEKAAKVFQQYVALLTDITLPIIFDIYPLHTEKEIAIGGVFRGYDTTRGEAYEEDGEKIAQVLSDFVKEMDAQSRVLFVRRYLFCESTTSLSKRFDLSENTVAVKLFRIRKRLKEKLRKEGIFL